MAAPAWLGIGAQRSGTTWFTDLLTQHPQVGLGTNGKKEQHLLHKVADGREPPSAYLDLFPDGDGVRRGEWTPQSLRHASAPAAAARLVPDAPVLVLLRDPVERFRSAMRLAATRLAETGKSSWPYPVPITVQTWTGYYADQLAAWAHHVGRDRMHVMVYETVRADPQTCVDEVWRLLGLEPVVLRDVESASGSSSRADWDWPEGLRESLEVLYGPQVARLAGRLGPGRQRRGRHPRGSGPRPRGQLERALRQSRPAQLPQPVDLLRRPGGQVVADRAGRLLVGRPPVLERRQRDRHRQLAADHVGEPRLAEQADQVTLA